MIEVEYVVGFLMSDDRKNIVLIQKEKPLWQKGKLNGVGGKIEKDESAIKAMRREFVEETGLSIQDWNQFAIITGSDYKLHLFRSFVPLTILRSARTVTEEVIGWYEISKLPKLYVIDNLKWLIPMALSMEADHANQYKIEAF